MTDGTFDARRGDWTVGVWWGAAGEIALGRVDDGTGAVTEAWTGPQVAWKMARGYSGAFGGRQINWSASGSRSASSSCSGSPICAVRSSLRNLDLLVLLSFSASLWFFNRGEVFTSVPLAYPPLLYLLGRMVWIGWRGGPGSSRSVWPLWLLAAATVFLAGFRLGLNVRDSNVIDVGYAGVIGAHRIVHGESPYGHMPVEGTLKPAGREDDDGEIRERVQTNGRCESANERGDTYGPVAYEAYVPAYGLLGWSGRWDELPAGHATAIAFDLLVLLGLLLVGRRFGGMRLAVALPFAWAAYPFTQYVSSSNTNDAIMPALLIWGFWLVTSAFGARRVSGARRVDEVRRAARGAALGGVSGRAPPLRERRLSQAVSWSPRSPRSRFSCSSQTRRTRPGSSGTGRSAGRWAGDSPFSIWGWGQYHARGHPGPRLRPADPDRTARGRCGGLLTSCRAARRRSSSPRSPPRS